MVKPVLTKDGLIAAFNAQCFAMDARLLKLADVNHTAPHCRLMQLLDGTTMQDPETTWWQGKNYPRYLNQWQAIEDSMDDGGRDEYMATAHAQLNTPTGHLQQFHNIVADVQKQSMSDPSYYKYLPHQIGWNNNPYGQELRETDGWQSIKMTCGLLPQVQISIQWVNHPMIEQLSQSFCLAVLMETTDHKPLLPKIRTAKANGQILAHH